MSIVQGMADGRGSPPALPNATQLQPTAEEFDLRLIVLFGSFARGRAYQDSDVDIGVLVSRPLSTVQRTKLWSCLSQLFQADVDLTVLNHVEPLLGYRVARDGVVLLEAEPRVWEGWKSCVVRRYWDTHKYRDALKDYVTRRAEEMRRASP